MKLDTFHKHEAMDRLHTAQELIHHVLASHPFVVAHPQVSTEIELAMHHLNEAYQAAGKVGVEPSSLDFYIDIQKDGSGLLIWPGGGMRPASDEEIALWKVNQKASGGS